MPVSVSVDWTLAEDFERDRPSSMLSICIGLVKRVPSNNWTPVVGAWNVLGMEDVFRIAMGALLLAACQSPPPGEEQPVSDTPTEEQAGTPAMPQQEPSSTIPPRGLGLAKIAPIPAKDLPRPEPVEIPAEPVLVHGTIDPAVLTAAFGRHGGALRNCVRPIAMSIGESRKAVLVRLTVGGTGQVVSAVVLATELDDHEAENCLTAEMRTWTVAPPPTGEFAIVKYPFTIDASWVSE